MAERTEFEPVLLPTRSFPEQGQKASYPSVCMNKQGYVVVFYQRSSQLYYRVGKFEVNGENDQHRHYQHKVEWGDIQEYGNGCYAQVAINDEGVVVMVRSRNYMHTCMYRVGKVQESLIIGWGGDERLLTTGKNPSVALKGTSLLFVHEATTNNMFSLCSYYNIATVTEDLAVRWIGKSDRPLTALDGLKQISVAVNAGNQVVFTGRGHIGSGTHYTVGKLRDDDLHDIQTIHKYTSGYYSKLSMPNSDVVVEVHEASFGSAIRLRIGHLQDDDKITWSESLVFDYGYSPSIAVCENYSMIEVHVNKRRGGDLMYRCGLLSERQS